MTFDETDIEGEFLRKAFIHLHETPTKQHTPGQLEILKALRLRCIETHKIRIEIVIKEMDYKNPENPVLHYY
jgi:hypothetical protein